jgi:O-antigen/teichoic acid export membrane protein
MVEYFTSLIKSSLVYGLGSVISSLIGFFLLPVYTRYLTPGDYGVLETLTTTTTVLTIILIFGMDTSQFRFTFDSEDPQQRRQVTATANVFIWGLTLIIVTVLLLAGSFISRILFGTTDYTLVLDIGFISAGIAAVSKIPINIFRINNQPTKYLIVAVFQILLTIALCIFFVVGLKKGVFGVITGTLIASVVSALLSFYLVRDHLSFSPSYKLLKEMLRFATPTIPANISLWILPMANRYFILSYNGTVELGLFSMGNRFASIISLAIGAFTMAWPQAAFSVMNRKDSQKIYARTLTYFVFAGCIIVLILSLFGKELLILMTTQGFFDAEKIIPILAMAYLFSGCFSIFLIGMFLVKKNTLVFPVTVVAAILSLILNIILIPRLGMMGAAWVTLISYLVMALFCWQAANRVYHVDYEWKYLGTILAMTVAVIFLNRFLVFDVLYFSIIFKLSLIVIISISLLYIIKFPMKETIFYVKNIYKKTKVPSL